ncbi:hypothetical protein BJX70DRAFT_360563 [Aspergillus crustosus]
MCTGYSVLASVYLLSSLVRVYSGMTIIWTPSPPCQATRYTLVVTSLSIFLIQLAEAIQGVRKRVERVKHGSEFLKACLTIEES